MGFKRCMYRVVSFFTAIFILVRTTDFLYDFLHLTPCLLGGGDVLSKLVRKPMNCAICFNASSIDTVEYIGKDKFEDRYAYTGRPLVVRGAARTWRAIKSFDFNFFKRLNNVSYMSSCQFLTYNDEFHNLDDVLRLDSERVLFGQTRPWYCGWSVCDPFAVNILRQYYQKPSFLPDNSENYIVDWIFMGATGYGAKLHIDDVGLPSWQAQIKGIKRWTLKTPNECNYLCRDSFDIDVFPGDIIVLDTNLWYHATEVISANISITIGAEYD